MNRSKTKKMIKVPQFKNMVSTPTTRMLHNRSVETGEHPDKLLKRLLGIDKNAAAALATGK